MQVKQVPVDSVLLDPSNVRDHGDDSLEAIEASLRKFGQQTPVVVDRDGIVRKGNGTVQAARKIGWPKIWILETHLTGAEATAYAIADNRTAEKSGWNMPALEEQLRALEADGFELGQIGFTDADFAEFFPEEPEPDPPDFQPAGEDEQGQLDEKTLKTITCPHCGEKFYDESKN